MNRQTSLIAVVLALFASCQSPRDLGVHAIQPHDIQIPYGMKLSTHLYESNTVEVGDPDKDRTAYRYADLVYRGSTTPMAILAYLKNRMPLRGYELTSADKPNDDTDQYVFTRGPWVATCTVRARNGQSTLNIRLRTHPKL